MYLVECALADMSKKLVAMVSNSYHVAHRTFSSFTPCNETIFSNGIRLFTSCKVLRFIFHQYYSLLLNHSHLYFFHALLSSRKLCFVSILYDSRTCPSPKIFWEDLRDCRGILLFDLASHKRSQDLSSSACILICRLFNCQLLRLRGIQV